MDARSIDAMAERLDRLERQARRWRWACLGLALGSALLMTGLPAAPSSASARQAEPPAVADAARDLVKLDRKFLNMGQICYCEDIKRNDPDPNIAGKLLVLFSGGSPWHHLYLDGAEADALRMRLKERAVDLMAP